jgi:hypothetical protein
MPRTSLVVFVTLTFSLAFMATAAWLSDPWWELAFRSDDSPVSWLSSALLFANAVLAFKLTLDRNLPPWLGAALALALLLMSLDEQFMFHERFKYLVVAHIARAHPWARWLAAVPMLAVGTVGVAFFAMLARAIPRVRAVRLLCVAVAVGLFALWINLGHPPRLLRLLEEGFEVLAETLFLCGLLEVPNTQVQSSLSS